MKNTQHPITEALEKAFMNREPEYKRPPAEPYLLPPGGSFWVRSPQDVSGSAEEDRDYEWVSPGDAGYEELVRESGFAWRLKNGYSAFIAHRLLGICALFPDVRLPITAKIMAVREIPSANCRLILGCNQAWPKWILRSDDDLVNARRRGGFFSKLSEVRRVLESLGITPETVRGGRRNAIVIVDEEDEEGSEVAIEVPGTWENGQFTHSDKCWIINRSDLKGHILHSREIRMGKVRTHTTVLPSGARKTIREEFNDYPGLHYLVGDTRIVISGVGKVTVIKTGEATPVAWAKVSGIRLEVGFTSLTDAVLEKMGAVFDKEVTEEEALVRRTEREFNKGPRKRSASEGLRETEAEAGSEAEDEVQDEVEEESTEGEDSPLLDEPRPEPPPAETREIQLPTSLFKLAKEMAPQLQEQYANTLGGSTIQWGLLMGALLEEERRLVESPEEKGVKTRLRTIARLKKLIEIV